MESYADNKKALHLNRCSELSRIKKELWGGEFWSDGGYIGAVCEGVTGKIIRNYIEQQEPRKTKKNINKRI